jgi:hypothetical protein
MWYKILGAILTCLMMPVFANNETQIKHAQVSIQKDHYVLAADIDYFLSEQVNEALQNGVPIFWSIFVKIEKKRWFWSNKTLAEQRLRYRLQYHALLNMYRVLNENTGALNSFSTLTAALNTMATVRDFNLMSTEALDQNAQYQVVIKAEFEENALPLPLRIHLLANSQWRLSSDWTYWAIEHANF